MQTTLTTSDILNEIEFELMQGMVSRDDLGEGLQTVRKYQNQIRGELLDTNRGEVSLREAFSRQLQINDLLLSLLHETASKVETLQLELHQSAHLKQHSLTQDEVAQLTSAPKESSTSDPLESSLTHTAMSAPMPLSAPHPAPFPSASQTSADSLPELESAMNAKALEMDPDVRVMGTPLIGGTLTRMRTSIHNLVLFYTRRLASKQAEVNRIYGEQLLVLRHTQQRYLDYIQQLEKKIISLEKSES
ncbi:MAG: hypothetical protein AAF639_01215 [Chloroflexota bacterium]